MIGLDGRELHQHHGNAPVRCDVCDGALIHQGPERTTGEKASAMLAYMSQLENSFFTGDLDTVFYKLSSGALRIIEHKKKGQDLTDGQKKYLPIFAWLMSLGQERLSEKSGVFVCYLDFLVEWDQGQPVYLIDLGCRPEMRQVLPIPDKLELTDSKTFDSVEQLNRFLRGGDA